MIPFVTNSTLGYSEELLGILLYYRAEIGKGVIAVTTAMLSMECTHEYSEHAVNTLKISEWLGTIIIHHLKQI